MVDVGGTTEIGGHLVVRIPGKRDEWAYRCGDCGTIGGNTVFSVGLRGCPKRPESLNYLSVCPGGDECRTHMDDTTPEFRAWKASNSMPSSDVPHYTCDALKRGERAKDLFLQFAHRIGLDVTGWRDSDDTVFTLSAEACRVGEFDHDEKHYCLWSGRNGTITVTRWNKIEGK